MHVLIVSNLDSRRPFGQFLRPFFLGEGLAAQGIGVAHVGVDCSRVDYGPSWSVGSQSLGRLGRATALACERFRPDVVYAHQNMPGVAALVAAHDLAIAADFHSLPSYEWSALAEAAGGLTALGLRGRAEKARAFERLLAARATLCIAASPGVARQISDRYRPRQPPVVVPNGVDHRSLEAPHSIASPYAGNDHAHAVATLPASSPTNLRALDFLSDVAGLLRNTSPHVVVHVLGASTGPGAGIVRYQGHVASVQPWLDHADACLLPYPPDAAPGGSKNKLLEALARGRRVVSTPEGLGGLEEAGDWAGVQVAAANPTAFAEAVIESVRPGAPTLDPKRGQIRDRYRWDRLSLEVAAALKPLASA